ncbi:MAG TPA: GPP34 family phosphoprotein [Trebonia sp.]|nr:GPP34 family phosphoprotein [Trebonia sp.]
MADEFWLMAHDVRGRCLVAHRVLSLCLAGGLLGELTLAGHVSVRPDVLAVTGRQPVGRWALEVCARVAGEPQPPHVWVRYLALTSVSTVAGRLAADGLLCRRRSRVPGVGARWLPIDSNTALMPGALLVTALTREQQMEQDGRLLGALAREAGLHRGLLRERWDPSAALAHLDEQVANMRPDLLVLVGSLRSALGSAVLVSAR